MNVQRFTAVAKMALPILAAAFALPAFAVDVAFTSTGSFSGTAASCGADCIVLGVDGTAVDLSATTVGPTNVIIGPELFVKAVTFTTVATNALFNGPIPANETFNLAITQTLPGAGNGSFVGDLSGTVSFTSSGNPVVNFCGAAATCARPTIVLDNVIYQLLPTQAVNLSLPSGAGPSNAGVTNVEMSVTPEPTFMMLTGLGFAGLAFLAYRRRRTV